MKRKIIQECILSLTIILFTYFGFSQTERFGTWTSVGIEKNLGKKWEIGAETELRTIYFVRLVDRWSIGTNIDYKFNKNIKAGIGYDFMNKLDKKYLNYQFRNRIYSGFTGKIKFKDITFSLRERIQLTFKDESNRIRTDGSIDTYKMNPEWNWRNRLQADYDIPHFRINPSFSVESFYQLNNPDGNVFDNIRYILGLNYNLNKSNHIEVFGVYNTELESEDAYGKFILGMSYKHKFYFN